MRRPTAQGWLAIVLATAVGVAALALLGRGDEEAAPSSSSTTTSAPTTTEPSTTATTTTVPTTTTTTRPSTTSSPQSTTTTATPIPGPAIVVRRGNTNRPVVALTFDAGSDTGYAAEILDTLAANEVTATFGMTGRWADANPALVRRMVADGHQLVNHSYDHPSFTGRSTVDAPLSQSERLDQLARADAAIRAAAGVTTIPWFRPPYGDEDASVRSDVALAGYRYELMWTVDSLGWQGDTPDNVVQRCLDHAVPGAIYLFHVGVASTDHAALQRIIDGLTDRGYSFATAAGLVTA